MSDFPIFRKSISDAFNHLLEAAKSLIAGCQELTGGITTQQLNKRLAELVHRVEGAITISERNIMASQSELAADLKAVLAQQKKTAVEIATLQASSDALKEAIVALEKVIASGEANPELSEAVAEVKAQAQVVDDQIPDVVAP